MLVALEICKCVGGGGEGGGASKPVPITAVKKPQARDLRPMPKPSNYRCHYTPHRHSKCCWDYGHDLRPAAPRQSHRHSRQSPADWALPWASRAWAGHPFRTTDPEVAGVGACQIIESVEQGDGGFVTRSSPRRGLNGAVVVEKTSPAHALSDCRDSISQLLAVVPKSEHPTLERRSVFRLVPSARGNFRNERS